MHTIEINNDNFPLDSWVALRLAGRRYVGRAFRSERANLVSTVDPYGKSITFSWPYVCANASEVLVIPIDAIP